MINYSSFSIDQLLAVDEVLDYLTDMLDSDLEAAIVYREYRLAHQAVTAAIDQQAREAAESAGNVPAADAPPAEDPDDLLTVVDALSVCSDRLAALARPVEMYFEESGQMDVFLKLSALRDSNRAIRNVIWR